MNELIFRNTTFDIVDRNGQPWLRYLQIGDALGYSSPRLLNKVFQKHSDEFTDKMTAVIKLQTNGGEQDVRIFSPRGCYALGMFARMGNSVRWPGAGSTTISASPATRTRPRPVSRKRVRTSPTSPTGNCP